MGIIHLCDSEKGGAGKSLWCRVLCQYFLDKGKDFMLVECDRSNADVKPHVIRPDEDIELEFAVFSENKRMYAEGDKLFNEAANRDVVITNLPAQVRIPFDNWLEQGDILSIAKDANIKFVKWFLVTGGVDSINLFKDSFKKWGQQIPHVLVKNLYMAKADEWESILEDDQELKKIQAQVLVCNFPEFPFRERNIIDRTRMRFDEAFRSKEVPVISRSRIQRFLNECHEGIEKVLEALDFDNKSPTSSASDSNAQKQECQEKEEEVAAAGKS